jgi:hypothetical protein
MVNLPTVASSCSDSTATSVVSRDNACPCIDVVLVGFERPVRSVSVVTSASLCIGALMCSEAVASSVRTCS